MGRMFRVARCPRCLCPFFTDKHDKQYCTEKCRKSAENARRWAAKKASRQSP